MNRRGRLRKNVNRADVCTVLLAVVPVCVLKNPQLIPEDGREVRDDEVLKVLLKHELVRIFERGRTRCGRSNRNRDLTSFEVPKRLFGQLRKRVHGKDHPRECLVARSYLPVDREKIRMAVNRASTWRVRSLAGDAADACQGLSPASSNNEITRAHTMVERPKHVRD